MSARVASAARGTERTGATALGVGAALGAAVAFAAAGGAARLLLAHPPARLGADFAQPLVVVTAWGTLGGALGALLALAVAAGAVAQLALVRALRDGRLAGAPSRALVAGGAILAAVATFAWPVVFSSDVYAYAAYGDLALRGADPYAHVAPAMRDPYLAAAAWQWSGPFPVCVYGSGFVALAAAAVAATRESVAATLLLLRLAAIVAFLAAAAAFHATLSGRPARARIAATATFALNPVLLWSVAEGHNDAFLLAAALGASALLVRGRSVLAGALAGLTPLLKAPGLAAAVLLGWLAAERMPGRAARRYVAAAAFGLALAAVFGLPGLLRAASDLTAHGRYDPQLSLQMLVGLGPALAAAAATAAAGASLLRRGRFEGVAWCAVALWLAVPNPYPWYGLWIAPVAAATTHPALRRTLHAATICVVLRYLPDAAGNMSTPAQTALAALAFAPFALLAASAPLATAAKKAETPS